MNQMVTLAIDIKLRQRLWFYGEASRAQGLGETQVDEALGLGLRGQGSASPYLGEPTLPPPLVWGRRGPGGGTLGSKEPVGHHEAARPGFPARTCPH